MRPCLFSCTPCKFKQDKDCRDGNQSTQIVYYYLTEMNPRELQKSLKHQIITNLSQFELLKLDEIFKKTGTDNSEFQIIILNLEKALL